MCTGNIQRVAIEGSGKGTQGWFPVAQANVAYDHASHAFLEYGLSVDFVNEELGPSARVAVELSVESARALAKAILSALETDEGHHSAPASLGAVVAQ